MASYWLLFDLRLETERLVLRPLTDDDREALPRATVVGFDAAREMFGL